MADQEEVDLEGLKRDIAVEIFTDGDTTQRWYNLYQLAIIISGLFTTATFPAIYPDYKGSSAAESPGPSQTVPADPNDLFRFFCITSFLASLVCIMCSFVVIILPYLHNEATWSSLNQEMEDPSRCYWNEGELQPVSFVQRHLAWVIRLCAAIALIAFVLQLGLSFAAAVAAAHAFMAQSGLKYASYVLVGVACFVAILLLALYVHVNKKMARITPE